MSELSKEELLAHLDFIWDCFKSSTSRFGKPIYPPIICAYEQIRKLIEDMPEVSFILAVSKKEK